MGCCGKNDKANDKYTVRDTVRESYGRIAATGGGCCGKSDACGTDSRAAADNLAKGIGYSAAELAALPEGANLGLSCGNPNAIAALQPGEVVLDLGSGGGFDVFVAARKVGPNGRAIGVDMTAEMLSRARDAAVKFKEQTGLDNVEFRLGEIEHLPLADNSVDVIISNCVINLSPDKAQVWREMARVLKPGGRVAVSDLALLAPLPEQVIESVSALVGCIAGAVLVADTKAMVAAAGLVEIKENSKPYLLDAMSKWSDSFYKTIIDCLPPGRKISDYVTSVEITARKEKCCASCR